MAPDRRNIAPIDALVLGMLALDGPCDRLTLASRLWPQASDTAATRNLRQHVFQIRRVAGDSVIVGDSVLALAPATFVDVHTAQAQLAVDPRAAPGDLLQGVMAPNSELRHWLDGERKRWRHRVSQWLVECADRASAAARYEDARPYVERMLVMWPDDETHYQRLMQLLYLQGNLGAAMEVFRRCEETLWREDRRRPGAPLRTLATTISTAADRVALGSGQLAVPVQMLRPTVLVAREADWQRLEAAWQAGQAMLVSGEPGVGKSRLIGEFATAWGALLVSARPGDASVPYGVIARVLAAIQARCGAPEAGWAREEAARIVPWVGATPQGPTLGPRLHSAIGQWFEAAWQSGLVGLVVDDLQYADTGSLEVLLSACTESTGRWLFAVRAQEWPALLRAHAEDPRSGGMGVLSLQPLAPEGVALLLEAAGVERLKAQQWSDAYFRVGGGNPYFVLQTLIGAQAQPAVERTLPLVPHLMEQMARRFDQLSPLARELVQVVAVAGEDFSTEMAASVMRQPVVSLAAPWRELERAHLLRGEGFAHDLAREAMQQIMSQPIALALHRQIASQAELLAMPPSREATHWLAAGEDAPAARALMQAASEAARLARLREQAQWLELAIGCFERLDDLPGRFGAMKQRLRVARFIGPYDDELARARALLAAADDDRQRCEALSKLTFVLCAGGRPLEGESHARESIAISLRLGVDELRRDAAMALAAVCARTGREDEGIALCMPHVQAACDAGDTTAVELLLLLGTELTRSGRAADARPLVLQARAIAKLAQDWGLLGQTLGAMGYAQHMGANVVRAAALFRQGLRSQRRVGPITSSYMLSYLSVPRLYREIGRYTQSLALLEEIRGGEAADDTYTLHTNSDGDLSFLWLQLGQPELALRALRSTDRPPAGAYAPSWLMARARIEHWAGRPAAPLLRECFDRAGTENRVLRWLAGHALVLSLPPDEGMSLAEKLVAECNTVEAEIALWPLHVAWCDRLLAAGDVQGASTQARKVLSAMARRIMPTLYHPQAWWIVGQALRAAQADAEARLADDCALRWIRNALPHVPPEFRSSFLHDNPFNRQLLLQAPSPLGDGGRGCITSS